ncbi:unnamed protein product [Tetraodon nigroviridis]|uniref:(spotted green pufferfish) hypothetical protein n=1 Tax=Tetraodon nigroviridis TaxID=99883 RepID=Q4SKN7_TETNG|nr:unnamed protein product [Tetraodon nigroviridis]
MQLVSDVRKFADVLLQLKDVFNSKGILSASKCTVCSESHASPGWRKEPAKRLVTNQSCQLRLCAACCFHSVHSPRFVHLSLQPRPQGQ